MADFEAKVYWPGVEQIESLTGSIAHGITPGVFELRCYPQSTLPATTGTLTLVYGDYVRRFDNCRVEAASYETNASGQIIAFQIYDFRWQWEGGSISGFYNMRNSGFGIVKRENPPNQDAINDSERTPQELARLLCEDGMKLKHYEVDALPNDARPSVEWDLSNPAVELNQLCESLACRVVIRSENKTVIVRQGEGADLSAYLPYEDYSEVFNLANPPSKIELFCGPNLYQVDLELEPVALESDGRWVPLDKASYKPAEGWEDAIEFSNIAVASRRYALESVYRHFRVKDVQTLPIFGVTESREQILPLNGHRADYKFDHNGAKIALPNVVYGIAEDVLGDDEELIDNANAILGVGTEDITSQVVSESFSINAEFGIVMFSNPMIDVDGNSAILRLRTAVNVRDPKTRAFVRYSRHYVYDSANPDKDVRVLRQDDIVAIAQRQNAQEPFGNDNQSDIDKEADYYLESEIKKVYARQVQSVTYIGWHPIELDGAIQAITWDMSIAGANMTVHRNHDPGSLITVPYKILRKDEANKKARDMAALAVAGAAALARQAVKK
jgi:hypothetical protein